MENNEKNSRSFAIAVAVLICVAIISIFVLKPLLSSVDTYQSQFESLDKKRNTVVALVASSSAASAVITLIPDDVGTPIADQLAHLSTAFLAILSVLLAERYLLPILGGLTTLYLIPFICLLGIIYLTDRRRQWLKNTVVKLSVLAVAFLTIIPFSVAVTDTIDRTFETSINGVIDAALESEQTLKLREAQDKNLWEKMTDAVSGAVDYVSNAVDVAKNVLGNYVEAIAVMMVTSCVIPIIILLVYVMFLKYVFGLDFSLRDAGRKAFLLCKSRKIQKNG